MKLTRCGTVAVAVALASVGVTTARADTVRTREADRLTGCVTWVAEGSPDPATRSDGDRYVQERLCLSGTSDRVVGVATDMAGDSADRTHSTCTWREGDQGNGHYEYGECASTFVYGDVAGGTIRVSDEDERYVVVRGFALGCSVDLTFGPRLGGDAPESEPAPLDHRSESWSESGAVPVAGRACDVELDPLAPSGELYWIHSHSELAS